ncbi:unnamed protein product [Didymodactylos carnosus]|uniref:Uncharacterized protein n=1 Tax=Didymodactylos carnosus TaxID=1234261 RepID=A0A814LTS3_9BILA|nr:unnamed protein product [Didymodactylos carnosus]CAF1198601.1 unnamed protein product [Didymodactylos carnosus]CAF3837895.1 unnamed protein product [Didymodactylos carnosus]CAF4008703.1 unnamed protein product [Didymodactylos carnosus]
MRPLSIGRNASWYAQAKCFRQLRQITFDQNKYICGVELILNLAPNNLSLAFIAFGRDYKVCGYNTQVRNNGLTFNHPPEKNAPLIEGLCQAVREICKDSNQQYSRLEDYIHFMSNQVPFGAFVRSR